MSKLQGQNQKLGCRAIAIAVLVIQAFGPTYSLADPDSFFATSTDVSSTYDPTCADVIADMTIAASRAKAAEAAHQKFTDTTPKASGQIAAQCTAYKNALDTANSYTPVIYTWAGVAVVCAGMCAWSVSNPASYMGASNLYPSICTIVQAGGTAVELIALKNVQGLMTAIPALGLTAKATFDNVKDYRKTVSTDPKKVDDGADMGACLASVTASGTAVLKRVAKEDADSKAQSALDAARKLKSDAANNPTVATGGALPGTNFVDPSGNGPQGGNSAKSLATDPSPQLASSFPAACGEAKSTGSTGAALQCAAAMDSNLPRAILDPRFGDMAKKATGMSLETLMNGQGGAAEKSAAAVMSATGNADLASAMARTMKQTEDEVAAMSGSDISSSYGGGGGGSRGGGGGGGDGMNDMLANMMAQFMPGAKGGADRLIGVAALVFAHKSRAPGSIAEDKTISIFDRVSYRYFMEYGNFGLVQLPPLKSGSPGVQSGVQK